MKETSGLNRNELILALNKIGKEHPEYAVTYPTFIKKQRQYLEGGIKALIRKNDRGIQFNQIYNEVYEYFKQLYLNPKRFSIIYCVDLISKDEKFKYAQIPSSEYLKKRLLKEYSQEKIDTIRNAKFSLPEIVADNIEKKMENEKIENNKLFEYYIDAIKFYFNTKKFKTKTAVQRCLLYSCVKNHLNPFFKDLRFKDITQQKINDFQKLKTKEGLSLVSISIILSFLSMITKKYSIDEKQFILRGRTKIGDFCCGKILSDEQIKLILGSNTDIKLIVMFAISLGINQAALLGLEYSDIDFQEKTIKINKMLYKGKIEKYNCHYQRRVLQIPKTLFDNIPKQESGRIFNILPNRVDDEITKLGKALKIRDLDYEDFIDTHVKKLIDNKIPISLISKNLGFGDIRNFIKRYGEFLPTTIPNDFDPLK